MSKMADSQQGGHGGPPKRGFQEVLSTLGKKSSSPTRKQAKKATEGKRNDRLEDPISLKSEIMDAINAALDSKLEQLARRIEAMVATKIEELEKKLHNEVTKLRDEVDDSINHVESVLKQDIDTVWEYAVRNEQYSRKNNLRILGLDEDEGENLEEKFIKFVGDNLHEEVQSNEIEIIHRIGAKRSGGDQGSRRSSKPRPVIVKLQSNIKAR